MAELGIAAAAALGTSSDTIRRRIKRGEIVARRDASGRWLVTVPEDSGVGAGLQVPSENPPEVQLLETELSHSRELLAETR